MLVIALPRSRWCVIQLLAATPETVLCTLPHRFGRASRHCGTRTKVPEQTVNNFIAARDVVVAVDAKRDGIDAAATMDVDSMSVKELKALIGRAGLSCVDCVEKSD